MSGIEIYGATALVITVVEVVVNRVVRAYRAREVARWVRAHPPGSRLAVNKEET